jgi:hypothetical protein
MSKRRAITYLSLALILFLFAAPLGTVAQQGNPQSPTPLDNESVLQEVILFPVADTYIASALPNTNFGSSPFLRLGFNADDDLGAERILLRFDLAGQIPDDAVIRDARLFLYVIESTPPNDAAMPNRLQRLESSWAENTVTWMAEPGWGPGYVTTTVGSAAGWYEWGITDLVREWAAGTVPNHGLQILGDEDPVRARERVFYSSETTTAFGPRLVVDYTVDAPDVTVDPLPEFSPETFTITWSGDAVSPAQIAHYDVQFRVDGGPWITDWITAETFTEAAFTGEHGRTYDFRARGVDTAGVVQPFGEVQASTTVDTVPPVSNVDPLSIVVFATTFPVSWSGEDDLSGIATFDIRYRFNGGEWINWLLSTTLEEATFDAELTPFPETDGLYEFEARATDNVGNVELFTGEPDTGVIINTDPIQYWFPLIFREAEFSQ